MPRENEIDCPALHKRSNSYPFGDRVPRTVRMLKTVTADPMPGIGLAYIKGDAPVAKAGQSYPVWTNSHGAVTAIMEDGTRLGLRPAEFEVDTWHHLAAEPARQPHPEPIAWMVGTAFWWTKEEAERDAIATGLPIVGLGPMAAIGPAEQRRGEAVAPAFIMPSCENCYGFGYVDGTCIQSLRGYRDHLEVIVDSIPEGPLYTHQALPDPGEVERLQGLLKAYMNAEAEKGIELVKLRTERKRMDEALVACSNERDELRKANTEFEDQVASDFKFIDDLRAQLAEAHALLREAACHATRMEPMSASCLNRIDTALDRKD